LLIVTSIIGIVANIAALLVFDGMGKAKVARVATDVDVIRTATQRYAMDHGGVLPRSAGWRKVPRELASQLPPGFEFQYREVDYRFHSSFRRRAGVLLRVPRQKKTLMNDLASAYTETGIRLGGRFLFVPFAEGTARRRQRGRR